MAMALHEGSPGHHLQGSIAAMQDLPAFRKQYNSVRKYAAPFHFPYYTAYVEVCYFWFYFNKQFINI